MPRKRVPSYRHHKVIGPGRRIGLTWFPNDLDDPDAL